MILNWHQVALQGNGKGTGFAAEYLRLRRVNWHRLRDKTIHLGCPSARPRHGEQAPVVPCLFFRFAQYDHITNQIAQMRFRVR